MTDIMTLIDEAKRQLDTYKHPDTQEVEKRLDEILLAGGPGCGAIAGDELTSLSFYNDFLHIETSYYVRSCSQTGNYKIPVSVLEAADPPAAMKAWAKAERVKKARAEVESAERTLAYKREQLVKAEAS